MGCCETSDAETGDAETDDVWTEKHGKFSDFEMVRETIVIFKNQMHLIQHIYKKSHIEFLD